MQERQVHWYGEVGFRILGWKNFEDVPPNMNDTDSVRRQDGSQIFGIASPGEGRRYRYGPQSWIGTGPRFVRGHQFFGNVAGVAAAESTRVAPIAPHTAITPALLPPHPPPPPQH